MKLLKLKDTNNSTYLENRKTTSIRTSSVSKKNSFGLFISAALAVVILLITTFSSLAMNGSTVFAKEEPQDIINEAAANYGAEGSPEGFEKTFDKFSQSNSGADGDSFSYMLDRLFTTHYINDVRNSVAPSGQKKPKSGKVCNAKNPKAGDLTYHNCDIPNITTEFLQDFLSVFTLQGPVGAEKEQATLDNRWFGLPSNLPKGGVPVDPSERAVKYTALELYGYNLNYTQYKGEWDHIKVMTEARAMANFGLMDNLKLSVTTIVNGITTGLDTSLDNAAESLSSGDVFGAIGGAFTGLFEGFAVGAVNTVVDTSDLNIVNTNGWYRPTFGKTLYNARELSQEEIKANIQSNYVNLISQSRPDDAKVPEDLEAAKTLPENPKEAISKCTFKNASSKNVEYGSSSTPPGVSEADCRSQAEKAFNIRKAAHDEKQALDPENIIPFNDKVQYTWTIDGNQKLETVAEWESKNSSYFDAADKYMMNCELDTNEANRKAALANIRSCWSSEWGPAAERAKKDQQFELNAEWVKNTVDAKALRDWMQKPENNFNAPWNRYVCLDSKGNDMVNSNKTTVMLYDSNGKHNDACKQVRAPIQNGFFGSGYTSDSAPLADTRNSIYETSILNFLVPVDDVMNFIASLGLGIAVLLTRISNTVLNLSFSPILETLGFDERVTTLIEALRDSLFFPLAALIIAIAGITVLFKAGKDKDYGRQATSLLLIVLTFVGGTILMLKPDLVYKAVDEIPSRVEQAIVGLIFTSGNDSKDVLCTATGVANDPASEDLKGNKITTSSSEGTRAMLCENWRVFAFNPWVYGQWGTGYENLDNSKMSNSPENEKLVGNAKVNMGGGKNSYNWALYQLDVTSSGTSTTRDNLTKSGYVDTDFYRIVDMQAGPNNGLDNDGRYLENWAGKNSFSRALTAGLGAITSIVGLVTITSFSITKITITLVTTFMLIFLPFAFLIGLHPTAGRGKLRNYISTIIGLMIKRIMIVALLAVMFRLVTSTANSAQGSYVLISLVTIVVCLVFMKFRKMFMSMIDQSIDSGIGQQYGKESANNPKSLMNKLPKSVRNYAEQGSVMTSGIVAGAIGGYLSGNGMINSAKKAANYEKDRILNLQRRRGYGWAQSTVIAAEAGRESVMKEMRDRESYRQVKVEVSDNTDEGYNARVKQNLYEKLRESHDEVHGEGSFDKTNEGLNKPLSTPSKYIDLRTANTAATAREVRRLEEINEKLILLKSDDAGVNERRRKVSEIAENDDINSIATDQERLRARRRGEEWSGPESELDEEYEEEHAEEIEKLEDEKEKLMKRIIDRENSSFRKSRSKREMYNELQRLVQKADEKIKEAEEQERSRNEKGEE